MKIRSGFVSNSSSSSFIIAVDDPKKPVIASFSIDLSQYADRIICTIEELEKWDDDWWNGERGYHYQKCKAAIERGKSVLAGYFSDECGAEEAFLCSDGLEGKLQSDNGAIVIQSDGGY